MQTALPSGLLALFALAAWFAASLPEGPQVPATAQTGTGAQERTTSSVKASQSATGRRIPCKTPENASLCYWAHGRLTAGSGDPSYRIWKIGTRRILGVFNGPSHYPPRKEEDVESPELPAELNRAYQADNRRLKRATGIMWAVPPPAFADFEICPLEPERRGWMQSVCIESAKNIFIQDDD